MICGFGVTIPVLSIINETSALEAHVTASDS